MIPHLWRRNKKNYIIMKSFENVAKKYLGFDAYRTTPPRVRDE